MNWKLCKSGFFKLFICIILKAYFRNASKDAKKEMNESNLKFFLNALIQLLDKWGGNYFSWEKIFDDEEDDNNEIDFGKFIKNEDFLENVMKIVSHSEYQKIMTEVSEINGQNLDQVSQELEVEELNKLNTLPFFEKFNKGGGMPSFSIEDFSSLLQLLNNPSYAKIIEKSSDFRSLLEQGKAFLEFLKNNDFQKCFEKNLSAVLNGDCNISTLLGHFDNKVLLNFTNLAMNNFGHKMDAYNVFEDIDQLKTKYVFNTIFEIIETEGREKIFKYTFSEAVKIMRISEIIPLKIIN
jgi:hypothetical protein